MKQDKYRYDYKKNNHRLQKNIISIDLIRFDVWYVKKC